MINYFWYSVHIFIRISNQPDKSETIKIETTTRSNNQNETAKDRELLALIKTTTNNGIRWEKKKILFHIDMLHIVIRVWALRHNALATPIDSVAFNHYSMCFT